MKEDHKLLYGNLGAVHKLCQGGGRALNRCLCHKASFGRYGGPLPVELAAWAFGDAWPWGCCRGGPAVAGLGGAEEVAAGGPGQLPGPETGIQGPEDRLCQR